MANCNKVAGQRGHEEAVVGVGNILDELDVSEWGVQLVDQLDGVVKLPNSKAVLVILDSYRTALTEHTVAAEVITSKAELLGIVVKVVLVAGDLTDGLFCSTWVVRDALKRCSVVEDYAISAVEVASAWERKLELRICRKVISDVVVENGSSCRNIKFKSYGTSVWAERPVRVLSWIKVSGNGLTCCVYVCRKGIGNDNGAISTIVLVKPKVEDDVCSLIVGKSGRITWGINAAVQKLIVSLFTCNLLHEPRLVIGDGVGLVWHVSKLGAVSIVHTNNWLELEICWGNHISEAHNVRELQLNGGIDGVEVQALNGPTIRGNDGLLALDDRLCSCCWSSKVIKVGIRSNVVGVVNVRSGLLGVYLNLQVKTVDWLVEAGCVNLDTCGDICIAFNGCG